MPYGLEHWQIISIVMAANVLLWSLIFVPLVRILHRLGLSGWWSLLMFFWPIGLWLLAFCRWPALEQSRR